MCIRGFWVNSIYKESALTQKNHIDGLADGSICFNRVTKSLIIKTAQDEQITYKFKSTVDIFRKSEFLDRVRDKRLHFSKEALKELFEGVGDTLDGIQQLSLHNNIATHGPGYTNAYFPNHQYPYNFTAHSLPRADEVQPLQYQTLVTDITEGHWMMLATLYENEAQIRDLFESKLHRFSIDRLWPREPDEQIALITGFVSEMANAHPYDDANNRTWIQIILNHLLRTFGQSDAILAVPNGFAAAVRYYLSTANDPAPGSPAYLEAMQPAIRAVKDGQRYYQFLCEVARRNATNIAPDRWL
ncbi:hypothetical protein [Pandoraea sputorum]|uniref:hypothetical protein n=1 Tax=Pandoraea sputorum TaxID=93222 RepID=UPI00124060EE|nr:hypothetical protein [Pandoraea sputorum]VVE56054.1 hypothetical protein PSP20601_05035 [Pandoraea sputorum]